MSGGDVAEYDYIIVGAGSAGCVIANRLTADPSVKVLLLEAGGWDDELLMKMPLGAHLSRYPHLNWGYVSEPIEALGRPLMVPRGKAMGGSSHVNAMTYSRGHPKDYDQWRQMGCEGWGYADVLPYFKRSERSWRGEGKYHGGSGEMAVDRSDLRGRLYDETIAAAKTLGFQESPDLHGEMAEGFSIPEFTAHKGRRISTSRAFIRPIRHRTNLTIETGALTSKVLLEGRRAVGVEYVQGGQGKSARASKEVILCGGTYNSPQLLMLSGIGPADHLRERGVEPVLDLPGVGQNLSEHASYFIHYRTKQRISLIRHLRWDRLAWHMGQWWLFGAGPFAHQGTTAHAQVRTRPELERPDIQIFFNPARLDSRPWFPLIRPAQEDQINAIMILLHPDSRGHVELRSADPADKPKVFLNILSERSDIEALIRGLRIARQVFEAEPLAELLAAEVAPGKDVQSDADLEAYLRKAAMVSHHPVGTCKMGHDGMAVVDPQLRVRGIEALRVCDASIMPTVPGGNTNAPSIMVGEKAADLIRGQSLPPAELD
jgi:choline dehydrogenase